ncbi:hypothetical protein [Pantoea sp. OXWO6B1]|uniref:hypothetical protein n=1 Tax=Pantoea sp. OXWO6B1 TaxID=1835724 RepID=UPI0007C7FBC9|nr:hypothetical protein [Pantoea sp. OXWO6B1]OAD97821.1 hypothetical protein A6A26_21745 [Pantoea sp. OXWO6B1]
MANKPTRCEVTGIVTVKIRGGKSGSRNVSRRSIAKSAMDNAKTSFEIEGHHYSNSDWSKIMRIADQLEDVI